MTQARMAPIEGSSPSRRADRRLRVRVAGIVQGVGFRPFVFGLAHRLGLSGYVLNDSLGVEIEIEGERAATEQFLRELRSSPPPLAVVQGIETQSLDPVGDSSFEIRESERRDELTALIPPDYATCPDCLREILDRDDRRHRYPFTNCTRCGPRYTIVRDLPYDRARTTMAVFEMCPACRAEYENPLDRRFHAEPTCCPECGPRVWLADASGARIERADPISECARLLASGSIVAIKGLGGFHLACDASDDGAVAELRRRKRREEKPFALMARDLEAAEAIAHISEAEKQVLSGKERPILLLKKKAGGFDRFGRLTASRLTAGGVSELVAPGNPTVGVMLPYAPLHHLLLREAPGPLVMTSGNVSEEAIEHVNEEALERLGAIADAFLLHNRDIHIPTDDSVARVIGGELRFLRRSRGYAPFPVELPAAAAGTELLAVGPELKNTVCLTRGPFAFLSHHIGELRNLSTYAAFLQAVEHLKRTLQIEPRAIVRDAHPDYLSTRYARESGLETIEVQHHHAHVASVLAEKRRTDRVIGVAFDGLGWGADGEAWGGEFLTCDLSGYERLGSLAPMPLPGGDATIRSPLRMAFVYLLAAFGDGADSVAAELLPTLREEEKKVIARMVERRLNSPMTTSAGRLFDAVSALLGICLRNSFEGQAPMELEGAAMRAEDERGFYAAPVEEDGDGRLVVRTRTLIRELVEDIRRGTARNVCAARLHNSVARFTAEACRRIRTWTRLSTVALSGGVFANAFLVERLKPMLESEGFEVLLNALVPPGDGGVSLGQAAVAAWRLKCA